MKYMALLLATMLCLPISEALASDPSANDVLAHIRRAGEQRALGDYFRPDRWPNLMRGIASGDPAWLRVYQALRPVSDGEAGEDLGGAIFDALPKQPFRVLPILEGETHTTVRQLCTFGFESKYPDGGIESYLTRLDRSLALAAGEEEERVAAQCQLGIRATRESIDRGT